MADYPSPDYSNEDLRRTYEGCLCVADNTLFYINTIISPKDFVLHSVDGKGNMEQVNHNYSIYDLDFEIPKEGVYNFQVNNRIRAKVLSRFVQRQWKRGANEGTFRTRAIIEKQSPQDRLHINLMFSIFFPKYYSLEESVKLLEKNKADSVALNNRFALMKDVKYPNLMLYAGEHLIGHYSLMEKKLMIHPAASHFIEEIQMYAPAEVIQL